MGHLTPYHAQLCYYADDPERRLVFHNTSYASLHAHSWDSLPRPLRSR